MFSPITQRSPKVRFLYLGIYALLTLGALTMILPFLIMLSGSVEPGTRTKPALFPSWMATDEVFWNRYIETRYHAVPDLLRMAWSDPEANFRSGRQVTEEAASVASWKQFLKETRPGPEWFTPGFLRQNTRMPSFTAIAFRRWLLDQYQGDLSLLNATLQTRFHRITAIQPPTVHLIGPKVARNRLMQKYREFCATLPPTRLIPWNVGGYYRAVYLPRALGSDVAAYNQKYGTHHASYREVSFPAQAPATGREEWFFFVSKILRPDFVELTESGNAAWAATGGVREGFIRHRAKPEHLRVISIDLLFAAWASRHGLAELEIPQRELDRIAFEEESGFWRWQFLTINYRQVLDEILFHGRAISNTAILIVLCVAGALIVNPLAAYALSRFKLKQTYFILLFCLATISFPAEVTMIPVFLQMKEFHLLNTFGALVLPGLANGFSIFLLKGFFDSLPKELYEAAQLDGASEWMMFWQITMNLSKPILAVIALGAFTSAYGAFFYALILAPDPKMWTVMVHIYQLRLSVDPPVVYASLIVTAIPTLLMFTFCQNLILRGIVVPSEK
ncbi:MAG TPA: carbohydrate ABC transporter permease [Chthoniobacteraceae bacterium]|nr:carbohydrate ABC transporter permease [Chthoniobacteraceae bacterium]